MPNQSLPKKRVAVVGSGVAGLTCAYYLDKSGEFNVTLFETDGRIGGHVNTIEVQEKSQTHSIDTGFIVCNDRTYPNFLNLISELGVELNSSEMSFSVSNTSSNLEYNGHNLNTLFGQRKNLLRPRFYRLIRDILVFNTEVSKLAMADSWPKAYATTTLGEFLDQHKYSPWLRTNYLVPMVAAIWSMGIKQAYDFPLQFFAKFFHNHGLLQIKDRPQWYTVKGGSHAYVKALIARFSGTILTRTPVLKVSRSDPSKHSEYGSAPVELTALHEGTEQTHAFDHVVFACHADTALSLLTHPSPLEEDILSRFKFTTNTAVLHTDCSLMPTNPRCFASWNYKLQEGAKDELPILTYYMNRLQGLNTSTDYMVSLNQPVREKYLIYETTYSHPVYNHDMLGAQKRWQEISCDQTHFAGAYWLSGFHEDGVRSALRVCRALGVDTPDLMDEHR